VNVLGNREDVGLGQAKTGHRPHDALTAVANDRQHILAVLIREDDLRSQQVRSALVAAAQIRAVAGGAVHAEERAAAGDHRGVAWRALLLRKVRALAAALTAGRASLRARAAPLLRCAGRRIL
jgi:hypothetical protein